MSPICTHLGCTATHADDNLKDERITFFVHATEVNMTNLVLI